jgi:hypothetical protein
LFVFVFCFLFCFAVFVFGFFLVLFFVLPSFLLALCSVIVFVPHLFLLKLLDVDLAGGFRIRYYHDSPLDHRKCKAQKVGETVITMLCDPEHDGKFVLFLKSYVSFV